MPNSALIEIQYLPPIPYFVSLLDCDEIILESHEHYVKQTYRNRCYINTPTGRHMLVVPVIASNHTPIRDVQIDYRLKWLDNHWRTIQSAYGKAPFFEYYADDLEKVMRKKFKFLFDLDQELLSLCLRWLKCEKRLAWNKIYEKYPVSTTKDLRNVIKAKNSTKSMFSYKGIGYRQVFGDNFVPDLSIIDLVFCTGPEARGILERLGMASEQIDPK